MDKHGNHSVKDYIYTVMVTFCQIGNILLQNDYTVEWKMILSHQAGIANAVEQITKKSRRIDNNKLNITE